LVDFRKIEIFSSPVKTIFNVETIKREISIQLLLNNSGSKSRMLLKKISLLFSNKKKSHYSFLKQYEFFFRLRSKHKYLYILSHIKLNILKKNKFFHLINTEYSFTFRINNEQR
jgi:hypothetical protein